MTSALKVSSTRQVRNMPMAERAHIPASPGASRPLSRERPGLEIRPECDRFEREADGAAAVVSRGSSLSRSAPLSPLPPRRPWHDRHFLPAASSSVDSAVQSPGHPLDTATRSLMEKRFRRDFGGVRLHTDHGAARSAQSIDARAYTAGRDIVFAPGGYQPNTRAGRHLLAHELAHVVQQNSATAPAFVQRLGVLQSIGVFFGLVEGDYSDDELTEYLEKITINNSKEDSYDSDNKARAIVRKWKAAEAKFSLEAPQRVLLIQEMQSGPTLGGDEDAILDLLELSDIAALRLMFAPGALDVKSLESDLDGDRLGRLEVFFENRFEGGRGDLLKGKVEPRNGPAQGAPVFAYDRTAIRAKIARARFSELNVVSAEIFAFSKADREKAIRDLAQDRHDMDRAAVAASEAAETAGTKNDKLRQGDLQNKADAAASLSRKRELVLKQVSRDLAITTSAEQLQSDAVPLDAARQAEARKALSPEDGDATFVNILEGETDTYETKLRALLKELIDAHYKRDVVGKGPDDHAGKTATKVRDLAVFERIGKWSKKETDKVFGKYYTANSKPELKADTATTPGNIHDHFAVNEKELNDLAGDKDALARRARKFLFYLISSNPTVRRLNHAHQASPAFDGNGRPVGNVAMTLDRLADEIVASDDLVKQLNEIQRGWPAAQRQGDISVQIFMKATPAEDRVFLWTMFQTLVHEYIHTLKSEPYTRYANSFGDNSNQYNTLIEGVDSLLDEVVWENIAPHVNDPELRAAVEGPDDARRAPIDVKPAAQRRYPSYSEALKLVDIVGMQNLYLAYFMGDVAKIGGTIDAHKP